MNTYLQQSPILQFGDIVSVPKGLVTHVGVVVSGGILENKPGFHERLVSLTEFCGGLPFRIKRTGADPTLVEARAAKILRHPQNYNVINRNCEHTVTEVVGGKAQSTQLVGWAILAGIVGLLLLARR